MSKKTQNYLIFDGLALNSESLVVEKDSENLPIAWRLLKTGDNALTQDGKPYVLTLSDEELL
ncbi:MAG: hypothetical protein LBM70_08295 [Victivallales bacterium]|nr:hypothetical protein [Victivallales bacterium]